MSRVGHPFGAMTDQHWAALHALGAGTMRARVVAERMGTTPAEAQRLLQSLYRRGYVETCFPGTVAEYVVTPGGLEALSGDDAPPAPVVPPSAERRVTMRLVAELRVLIGDAGGTIPRVNLRALADRWEAES